MPRYFTLREAEGLLPTIRDGLEEAIADKERVEEIDQAMSDLSAQIGMTGGMEVNPSEIAHQRLERVSLMHSIEKRVSEIQRSGCLVKDLDLGLLDFPALLHGEEVYLCWRLGEPKIEWWHSTEEGYSSRRRIMGEFEGEETLRPN